ncbi:IS66 family insertion sequence element accessory protein TnpA [Sphingobacterium sp.]|uniref:IS66 family insertion sequence element accessory protein TnpA n=1 Tax=Sphingobacterium sp. TaxID=341027 RepID=UPI00391CD003
MDIEFGYWISKWKEEHTSSGSPGFIPMGSPRAGDTPVLSVVYPNGVRLEVPSADLGLLSSLIGLI